MLLVLYPKSMIGFQKTSIWPQGSLWPIPAYSSLFQPIPAYSSLFHPDPAPDHNPDRDPDSDPDPDPGPDPFNDPDSDPDPVPHLYPYPHSWGLKYYCVLTCLKLKILYEKGLVLCHICIIAFRWNPCLIILYSAASLWQ